MSDRATRAGSLLAMTCLALTSCVLAGPATADDYETPPMLQASDVLPAEARKGPHHEVSEEVQQQLEELGYPGGP